MAGIAGGWITWVWRASSQASGAVSGEKLGRLADLLAGAAETEWTRAAGERGLLEPEPIPVRWQRPAAPVAGPVAAAVASTRFAPLPGLTAARQQRLQAGQVSELHEVYGGLGSGRLVIAGGPGAGKTSAAVLLILAALRHRSSVPEQARPQVPVPVLFTVHGWDPGTQRARDWLAERLWRTYPLFAGKQGAEAARGLLDQGRIAVILDGLDEIPQDLAVARSILVIIWHLLKNPEARFTDLGCKSQSNDPDPHDRRPTGALTLDIAPLDRAAQRTRLSLWRPRG